MNSTFHFAKLDMLSFKPYRKFLLLLPFAILVIFDDNRILATPSIVFIILTSLAPHLFASEDKNSMHRLYALLPVSKEDVVYGRYICCFFGALIYIILMTFIQCVCSEFTGFPILYTVYGMIICTGLFLLATAIQFPVFFKLGFIKGRFVAPAPGLILLGTIMVLRQFTGVYIMTELTFLSALNSVFILIAGIVAIVISVWVSVKLYQSREE